MGTYELAWIVGGAAVYVICTLWTKTRPTKTRPTKTRPTKTRPTKTRPTKGRCTKCAALEELHEGYDGEKLCDRCDEKSMESN